MAELTDVFLVIGMMFLFGVSIFASDIILSKIVTANNTTQVLNQSILVKGQGTIETFDLTFAIVLIGIGIALLVTAFFIDQHPIFLPLNIIVFIIVIFVAANISNAFITFAETPAIIDTANKYGNVIYIYQHLPTILMFMMALAMIVGFAKISSRRTSI